MSLRTRKYYQFTEEPSIEKIRRVQSRIKEAIPDAEVTVRDMTGAGDHFEIIVLSRSFQGKTLIEQHQRVHQALEPLKDEIHAVALKTRAVR